MIGSLVTLLVLAAAAAAVVAAGQRRATGAPPPQLTAHSVRRFFQYLLLAGLLFAAGAGLTGLLSRVLDVVVGGGDTLVQGSGALAWQLTFTVVALPLWAALAWWTRQRQRSDPEEGRALLWTAYLTLVLLVSLVLTVQGWYQGVTSLLRVGLARPGELALGAVWLGVWWLHRRWAAASTSPGQLRLEQVMGALVALVLSATALVMVLRPTVQELLGLSPESLVGTTLPRVQEGLVLLAVAGAFWVVYWRLGLARAPRGTGWLALVLLVGVGAALVTAVTAASLLLWSLLVWLVGSPAQAEAREHFLAAPTQLATVVVGLLVWWYHQEVLAARRTAPRGEVRRVYEYLMSAVGLLAAGAGLMMLLVTLVEALAAGADLVVGGSAVNALLAALVLLAVGLPVWWWHWRLTQRARAADPAGEVASPARRFYLLVLFGVMGVAAVIALLTLVYLLLRDALDGRVGAETLRSIRFALGVLVTTSLLSAYHWTVFRADRELVPEVPPVEAPVTAPRRVLLVGADDAGVARALAGRTGARVELAVRTDDGVAPWSLDELAATVEAAPDGDLVVLAEHDGHRVVPVRR